MRVINVNILILQAQIENIALKIYIMSKDKRIEGSDSERWDKALKYYNRELMPLQNALRRVRKLRSVAVSELSAWGKCF